MSPVSPAASRAVSGPVTVTLITGDRVTVTGSGAVLVERGEGRAGVTFTTDERNGRLRVFPGDAFAPLRESRLDPRLFDVSALIEFGYDDRRGDLPLIVTGRGTEARNALRSEMTASGATVTRDLAAVDGVAVRAPRKERARFWNEAVSGIRTGSGGVLVAEQPSLSGEFTVPAGAAGYRLVMESERGAPAVLSTRTSTAWTFRSENAGDDTEPPLPISVVRFSPALDAHNTAPGGVSYRVPVSVRRQAGSGSVAGRPRDLAVEVSYDDGATWSRP